MISTTNLNEARKLIQKLREKPLIIKAQGYNFNRKILEVGGFDILLSPERNVQRDRIKQLDSGLNHVLAKIAAKNKIAIGVDLTEIMKLEKKEKAKTLARIKQNVRVCRKAKTKLQILNYKDKKDAQYFLLSLEASTKQTKEAFD